MVFKQLTLIHGIHLVIQKKNNLLSTLRTLVSGYEAFPLKKYKITARHMKRFCILLSTMISGYLHGTPPTIFAQSQNEGKPTPPHSDLSYGLG